jgi:hypothetical protein
MRILKTTKTILQAAICTVVLLCGFAPAHAQDFIRTTVGTTTFTTPVFQQRYNSQLFNPPLVYDLGNTAAQQNILQAISLAGFANTLQVTPPTAARTTIFPDASGTLALMPAAGGQVTTNGTAVAAGVCQAQPALTITGVTTTSTVSWSVPTALPATWQTGIFIQPVVTANTVTLSLCNGTAGSITPAAQAVNVRALL